MRLERTAAPLVYAFLGALLFWERAHAQAVDPFAPPANYYASAVGAGPALKSQLRTIVSNMSGVSYGDARYSPRYTDPDPNASGRILLIYDRASVSWNWDSQTLPWNREHIWPASRLDVNDPNNSTVGMTSDQFNLRPAEPRLNQNRGNSPFGMDTTTGGYGYQGSYFYPGDADAGDVARSQFYMTTRYSQLSLTDASQLSSLQMGDLSSLINYHFRDAPDAFERRRNHAIYGLAGENSPAIANPYAQENRNPYVDRPEYVWSVFVDQANDSQIALPGGMATGDGGSTLDVNLGRVILGAPAPSNHMITVNKGGDDGAYFQVTTTGAATSGVLGRHNAFRTGGVDSRSWSVGLAASTSTPGAKTGSVIVDNLDITTGGGAGRGANDENDVINVSLDVLSHANPSFSAVKDVDSLTYDFGKVALGAAATTFSFDVANLETTAGFTAGLELDSISSSGDAGAFVLDLATFSGAGALPAGASNSFTASLDTAALGNFSVTYSLAFSDENLPGAAPVDALTLTLIGVVEAASSQPDADFDSDGDVDGADFLAWQRGLGRTGASLQQGDANADGVVDAADLQPWAEKFGSTAAASAAAVPEPGGCETAMVGVLALLMGRFGKGARAQ